MRLVVVESPKKARTIRGFLGAGYQVAASMGHVRDLPPKTLGVDLGRNFAPAYVVLPRAQPALAALRKAAAGAESVLLATDPDREGEAIAWHIAQALHLSPERFRRVTFHEISRPAVREALAHPRALDPHLIDAQQARRVLDRLVGYGLSPLLWRKVQPGTSAGRVQSVAVRLIVDREREIAAFESREYWTIDVRFSTHPGATDTFLARLQQIDGQKAEIPTAAEASALKAQLEDATYRVADVSEKTTSRHPYPPFTTSALQQAAGNRLRFAAKKTMTVAQGLYEAGLITYMRTDSVAISAGAIAGARRLIEREFGAGYVPPSPRRYITKTKNAQEAHEAIRPVDVEKAPASLRASLTADEWRLYELIWKRTIASQMAAARSLQRSALIDGVWIAPGEDGRTSAAGERARHQFRLRAVATQLTFPGWLKLYGEDAAAPSDDEAPANASLPDLERGQALVPLEALPAQHFTQPPPRYTEPALVKALEEAGVGRPSTYATVVSTIQERGYVRLERRHFVPTELGNAANDFLVAHFPRIVDLPFTAQMEDSLDEIAGGRLRWTEMLHTFYGPFQRTLALAATARPMPLPPAPPPVPRPKSRATARAASRSSSRSTTRSASRSASPPAAPAAAKAPARRTRDAMPAAAPGDACPQCGRPLVERRSQYGPFQGCSGFPACRYVRRDGTGGAGGAEAVEPATRGRGRSRRPAPDPLAARVVRRRAR